MSRTINSARSYCLAILLLLLALSAATVRAGAEPTGDVLTELMLAKIRFVGSVQMSPDGALIAYTLSVPRPYL